MSTYSANDYYDQINDATDPMIGKMYTDANRDRYTHISGEVSADNALARQEYFYNTYQSPEAMLRQYKEAGLSPSLMFSKGAGGGAGTTGVAGTPRSSSNSDASKMSSIFSAVGQAAQLATQIAQVKAQTQNLNADTALKMSQAGKVNAETEYQNYINENQNVTNKLANAYILQNPNDMTTGTSFFDIACISDSYGDFMKAVKGIKWGSEIQTLIHTENGQRVLRDIYINSKEQSANIAALNKQQTNDELATQILKVLNKEGYSELSAQEQLEALRRSVETNKLDKETNEAWNNLLNKLGDGTKQDTAIVIALLLKTLIGQTHFSTSHSTIEK